MPRNIFGDPYNRLSDLEYKINLINQEILLNNKTLSQPNTFESINLSNNNSNYQLAVTNNNSFYIDQINSNSTFYIDSNKNIGIGTITPDEKLNVNGNLHVNNSLIVDQNITASNLNQLSDIKLKSNIKPLTNSLDKVEQLRGVSYLFNNQQNIGLIAQEVEKIIPEVVNEHNDCKTIAYGNLIALLVEAIKELNQKITKLENNN